MASITFTVANKTSTLQISDERFVEIARIIIDAELADPDGAMTIQEKLDWFTRWVARDVRRHAIKLRERELDVVNRQTIESEFSEDWTSAD